MVIAVEEAQTAALLDDRYQLHERVGVGGMAEIYRADDVVLGRTVAIKLMRSDAEVLASPARVQREADALATLSHPAVVTLLDARISGGNPRYLVMEFVDGPTLADLLGNGPLPPAAVVQVATDIAAGLEAVHAANLVHRDVKPSNILLAPAATQGGRFDAKLADFGLAHVVGGPAVTSPGVVFGTAAYIAPEQARGETSGPSADIYAFGLVLLEAITGERPFGHGAGAGVVVARLLDDPAIPADVDPQWAQLIRSMTAADPDDRPTASEVARTVAALPVPHVRAAAVSEDIPRTKQLPVVAPPIAAPTAPRPRLRARQRIRRRLFSRPVVALASVTASFLCLLGLMLGFANQGAATQATNPGAVQTTAPSPAASNPPKVAKTLPSAQPVAATTPQTSGPRATGKDAAATPKQAKAPAQTGSETGRSSTTGPAKGGGTGGHASTSHPAHHGPGAGKP